LIVPAARNPVQNPPPARPLGSSGKSVTQSVSGPPSKKDGIDLIRKLPPLPMVVTKLMQLLQRSDVGLKEISDSISSDPAFSGEVLRMANSAMVGAMSEIRSIWQALAMVGTDRIKSLALTVGMRGFMGKSSGSPVLRQTWRHTLATAIIAEEFAGKIFIDPAEAYTAGLLHDIGRIALISTNPQKYADLLGEAKGASSGLDELEQNAYGINRREAGVELVRKWKLPPLFERVISGKQESDPDLSVFDCPALIALACSLADALGLGLLPQAEGYDWKADCDRLLANMPEADRGRLRYNWDDLQLLIASKVNLLDSEAAK
jgi:putative nucleotidyltransferase with HDIG domain